MNVLQKKYFPNAQSATKKADNSQRVSFKLSWLKMIIYLMAIVAKVSVITAKSWDGGANDYKWSSAQNWDNDVVPLATDSIFLDCSCKIDVASNIVINGTLEIAKGTTLNFLNFKSLDVGTTNKTSFITNYGTITNAQSINIQGTVNVDPGPYFYNYGKVANITKLVIGNNRGDGLVINYDSGSFSIKDVVISGTLENYGLFQVSGEFLLEGGVLNGDGTVIAEDIRLIKNNNGGGAAGTGNFAEINGGSFEYTGGCSDGGDNPNNIYVINKTKYTFSQLVIAVRDSTISGLVLSPQVISCNDPGFVILPIKLLSFQLAHADGVVNILWSTGSELNNDFFTIERSLDGQSWEVIKVMEGAGTSKSTRHYQMKDQPGVTGLVFYRLKQTDYDGKFEYFDSKAIRVKSELTIISVYPNPAIDNLNIYPPNTNTFQVTLSDFAGREIPNLSFIKSNTELKLSIADLPSGVYFINVADHRFKIIKH